jgi:AraC-like DNA-binding protein
MYITSVPALLGFAALVLLVLLTAKILRQPAQDKAAKRLLFLLLIGLIALASCTFFFQARIYRYWPRLTNIEIGFVFWIGPSLYFYLKCLSDGANPFAKRLNAIHWLPGVLVELVLVPFYLMSEADKIAYLESPFGIHRTTIRAIWWGFHVQLLAYIAFCLPLLRTYRQRIIDNHSDDSLFSLRWLQLLCYGFVGVVLVERVVPLLDIAPPTGLGTSMMVVYLFIISVAYLALGQSRLQFANGRGPSLSKEKYRRSGLQDHACRYYLRKLDDLMVAERCYLDNDLSLQSLANRLNIRPHHLSQILNEKLKKSFYDYVNEQRVEHAKQLLVSEPERSVTNIAFESGYNSKNSFYNAFKRHAGTSPTDYRRKRENAEPT